MDFYQPNHLHTPIPPGKLCFDSLILEMDPLCIYVFWSVFKEHHLEINVLFSHKTKIVRAHDSNINNGRVSWVFYPCCPLLMSYAALKIIRCKSQAAFMRHSYQVFLIIIISNLTETNNNVAFMPFTVTRAFSVSASLSLKPRINY